MKRMIGFLMMVGLVTGFVGCGDKSAGPNGGLTANAGPDINSKVGDTVYLDGSNSVPSEVYYKWWYIKVGEEWNGETIREPRWIDDGSTSLAYFKAEESGVYVFRLEVSLREKGNFYADFDTVVVYIDPLPNRPPVARAGDPIKQHLNVNNIQLDATGSEDADGDILTFKWIENDQNPVRGILSDPTTAKPIFIPTVVGEYKFSLIVNDGQLESTPSIVVVTVTPNSPPVADAGDDISVQIGDPDDLTSNSGKSYDPDGDTLVEVRWWYWHKNPSHSSFGREDGTYLLGLTVFDGMDWSEMDWVRVTYHWSTGNNDEIIPLGSSMFGGITTSGGGIDGFGSEESRSEVSEAENSGSIIDLMILYTDAWGKDATSDMSRIFMYENGNKVSELDCLANPSGCEDAIKSIK